MKMKFDKLAIKLLCAPVMLGLMSVQAHALPKEPGIAHPPHKIKPNTPNFLPSGMSPSMIRTAYGFNSVQSEGAGQVIAIVDAFDDPNAEADLGVFSKEFGLPTCTTKNGCFKKVYASGRKPKTDPDWSVEISLDVQWAHAMAPAAKIILVEAASDSMTDLMTAVQVAVKNGANVVSMSWGGGEFTDQTTFDAIFNNPNVTFVASSGDSGAGTMYPASSPYVLAVGGTTLSTDAFGNHQGETAWSGSSGGVSAVEAWPASQSGLPIPQANNMRGVPDVAYNADPNSGFSIYDSVPNSGGKGWTVVGGTSAGSPQWAALIAVANAALNTNLGNAAASALYSLANPSTGSYSADYYDIIDGTNGTCGFYCTAQDGYDYVTGLGSPQVPSLISNLSSCPIVKELTVALN